MSSFDTVKAMLLDLDLSIVHEDAGERLAVVDDPERGVHRLVVDCEDPIVILEQALFEAPAESGELHRRLLQMSRTLVHGAFVLDESGRLVSWRDTLRLSTLDAGELEASIGALSLGLAEHGPELLRLAGR